MADAENQKEELYDDAIDAYADEKYDEAIALYQKALEIDPKYIDALHGLTMCYQAKGDLDQAIELTRRHIAEDPEDILAHTNLSMFYQKKGMVPEAEAAGAEARRLDWKRQLKEGKPKA
ncbi:MAG: tetratricopeptide repeat protein [Candidatus Binatus sp.]|uniref:tetratricopeptide repeat protein n=1 Tax=Candidatus Binatus sp. TaxID=2811406 RepID=UPI00271C49FA|nr:tetratricopeptide repeat protein [Candidatus Binatus sp.]MDO8433585.1 tetratricopeptide repeat protein [Candidatus Binatus sp.]